MSIADTIAGWYIKESGGDITGFSNGVRRGDPFGQIFFNALTHEDQDKLRGSLHDPYHGGVSAVREALDFLTGGK
jgi:hypothetical protein